MKMTVFYSWQSDLPNSINRGFIEDALERAVKNIRNDDSISIEPVLDRDTAGIPGSPDIAATIFSKIDHASVFVGDVSFINTSSDGRRTPNPNVAMELGYALKSLGSERVIAVFNEATGKIENLPFDLKMRRVETYRLPEGTSEKSEERKKLSAKFETALRYIFLHLEQLQQASTPALPPSLLVTALESVESNLPKQKAAVRDFMTWLVAEIESHAPDFTTDLKDPGQRFYSAVMATKEKVADFAKLSQVIAIEGSIIGAETLLNGFKDISERIYPIPGTNNVYRNVDFDFFRFLLKELFTIFITTLVENKQWTILSNILTRRIVIKNAYGRDRSEVTYLYFSQPRISLLDEWNESLKRNKKSSWCSPFAALVKEHIEGGPIEEWVEFDWFIEGEFFLFLRSLSEYDDTDRLSGRYWIPEGAIYLESRVPTYLTSIQSKIVLNELLAPLACSTPEDFIVLLKQAQQVTPQFFTFECRSFEKILGRLEINQIGIKK